MSRARISPSLVVALLALVVALGGTAYAAGLARNSVGTPQLKKNAVISKKVKNNSLTGADVNEATLRAPAGSYSVSGHEFQARDDDDTKTYDVNGAIYRKAGLGFFAVRLQVPQGALITGISFHVMDNSAPGFLAIALSRFEPAAGQLVNLATSPAAVVPQDSAVHTATLPVTTNNRVDNSKYTYYAMVDPSIVGDTMKVYGATVTWTR